MVKKLLQQRRKTGCIKPWHHLAGRKKLIVAEQDREDVRKARQKWKRKQGTLKPWRLVTDIVLGLASHEPLISGSSPSVYRYSPDFIPN